MVKIKKEIKLIEPKDIKPSSKDFKIIGVLNPAAVRMKNGKIFMYVRVIEKLIKTEDSKYCYSPRLIGTNNFKVKIEKFNKKKIKANSDLDFIFNDGTKRMTFLSHFRKIILDKTGFQVLEIDEKPSFYGIKSSGEFGGDIMPVVFWSGKDKELNLTTMIQEVDESTLSLVGEYYKWKD